MAVLTAGSLLLIPKININADMTRYLPDDSRMKAGVDTLKRYFPEVDMNAIYVKAMFSDVDDGGARGSELAGMEGVGGITSVSSKDGFTMYQLSVKSGADPKAVAASIESRYCDDVVVEHNANSIMPDNMGMILTVGLAIVFAILFLMCSSFVEALLFIMTIGMAVILNMGTNAFLPSVSMLTNTIVAVLQFVLSMDYSIILMNRFRQEMERENDIDKAMSQAIKSASPSILSSSLTTIAGLLALVFMKFKIGLDLGVVLAKGVLFSLISIYTILPALILFFYKGIRKTEKKVFFIPTDSLARFELKFRIPLAILFIAIFASSWYLSKKTELSYASIWESSINDVFQPQNTFSILYKTQSEDKVISLSDSLVSDPDVLMALSYPSIFKKELTAEEMCGNIRYLLSLLPNMPGMEVPELPLDSGILNAETMRFLYYAASHPEHDEKMSFEDMISLAEEASESGLLPEGMDVKAMISGFMTPEVDEEPLPEPESVPIDPTPAETQAEIINVQTVDEAPVKEDVPVEESRMSLAEIARPAVDESGDDPYNLREKYHFTKEKLNTQMNYLELAEYLGFSKGQASAAYSMAKKKNGTMTPSEFIDYMIEKVLGNKLLCKMISDKQAEGLYVIRGQMDAVLTAPDFPNPSSSTDEIAASPETVASEPAAAEEPPIPASSVQSVAVAPEPAPSPVPEFTPMDRLAEMYASGRKYSAGQIYNSLHLAGIDIVDEGIVDLMFTYYGSKQNRADSTRMSLDGIIDFLSTEVAADDAYSAFLDDSTRVLLNGLRGMVDEGMKMLRTEEWSMAAVVTGCPLESSETFSFVENTIERCRAAFGSDDFYLIGESVMYKEMKDGFRKELLFLTFLTIISIFLIVAITFKSVLIPTILVMAVMTGVFVNVFFSGLGGNNMLYLAYLIVQSILMGATIDYGILFTNYYLGFRHEGKEKAEALKRAYRGSIHTIMTSGLIIICAPLIMSELLTDPTICSILSSLTFGALSAISVILFILPAVLSAVDSIITRRRG